MAQKRMFDKKVIGSDKFLDLPNSSKALYFMAGMEADDKGFFQPRKLQKMCGFSDDDYKILIAKGFFITFESGVMVVTDWNKNNWLDSRRITETEYTDELNLLKLVNQKYEFRLENDNAKPLLSEYSIDKNRIDKNSIVENSIITTTNIYSYIEENFNRTLSPIEVEKIDEWLLLFNEDIIKYAIKIAVINNAKRFNYVNKILENWKVAGYKTLQEIKENEKTRKEVNEEKQELFDYNWLDEEE